MLSVLNVAAHARECVRACVCTRAHVVPLFPPKARLAAAPRGPPGMGGEEEEEPELSAADVARAAAASAMQEMDEMMAMMNGGN